LLAEDSPVNQKLVVALMSKHGHHVTIAEDGKAAVKAVEATHFDLILMDVEMPEMNGLEATAVIRSREERTGQHVPVIAMTAHAMKGDRQRCLDAGMDDYVSKPIHPDQLFEKIADVISRTGAYQRNSATGGREPDVLDWVEVLAQVEGDRGLLKIVVDTTLKETPVLVAEMRKGLADGDADAVTRAAHALRESLRYFGDSALASHVSTLESLARNGELEDATEVLLSLEKEADRLLQRLRDFEGKNRMDAD
jgi:CheY-like chemotaxis protein